MTKAVRIENADAGTEAKLLVQVWEKGAAAGDADALVHEHRAELPAAMVNDYVTATRYITVKELP